MSWLVAVQAQDYAGAKWALGLRMRRATDEAVERAFTAGALLRTHVLRPTWHFVAPADIRWLLALTAPRVHAANAHMYRKMELDDAVFRRSHAALTRALQGGHQLTREELGVVHQNVGIATDQEFRLAYLMMRAELEGIVCSGARRGKQFTYALLDERVPPTRALEREEALAALAGRYFRSRGPATVRDFAKWSGLTVGDATCGLEAVKAELRREVFGERAYWSGAGKAPTQGRPPIAHLLSIYDEYISSYKDRSGIVDGRYAAKLRAMGNALNHVVLVDGQIVGSWRRAIGEHAVVVETSIFRPLKKPEKRAVVLAAERYGKFLGLPVVPREVGPKRGVAR